MVLLWCIKTHVITQKEEAILNHIKDTLQLGMVKNFGKFSRFIVRDKESIKILIFIFNGNIFLDKRKVQLNKWLEIHNINNINNNVFGWISGLIDAEGCFYYSFQKKSYGFRLSS